MCVGFGPTTAHVASCDPGISIWSLTTSWLPLGPATGTCPRRARVRLHQPGPAQGTRAFHDVVGVDQGRGLTHSSYPTRSPWCTATGAPHGLPPRWGGSAAVPPPQPP